MAPSASGTARGQLWLLLKVLDYGEARTVVCRLRSLRDFVPKQTLESSQISPESLELDDLRLDLGEVLPHNLKDVLARRCPLVPHSKDTANIGQRRPKCLRPADEAEALHGVLGIYSVAGGGTRGRTNETDAVVVAESLRLDVAEGAETSNGKHGALPLVPVLRRRDKRFAV